MEFFYEVTTPSGEIFEVNPTVLNDYRSRIGIDHAIAGRYSNMFLADIYQHERIFGISSDEVLEAIKEEESGENLYGAKASTPFNRYPLKGLWHKHYISARFIPHNIYNAMQRGNLERIVREVYDPKISPVATEEMGHELANRVVTETLRDKRRKSKMTGEWIVFAKYQGKNYYLCMGTHKMKDIELRNKIDLVCVKEFPFLKGMMLPREADG
ncbi:hypothetical protein HJ200_17165 [Vibrio parahaemolyticus]|nr:hypothetical protein [Vibrio parahaemolyticus]